MDGVSFKKYPSTASPCDEIVITGISGRYPESRNIKEFGDNLLAKKDLLTDISKQWDLVHPYLPKKTGKIHELDKFDAGFFGVHHRQADIMDPLIRKFLEVAIEAVMDAGLHPSELEGSKTGVFIGTCLSDTEMKTLMDITEPQMFGITGYLRSSMANRISYYLKLKGPSYIVDAACSSSLYALEEAFKAIRSGKVDNALVGGANLCMHPDMTIQFQRLGVLSMEGVCKVFDQDADGYVRSDTATCVLLQKSKNARRIYGRIVYTHVNSDGFKSQGINFPSAEMQQRLMKEVLDETGIHPSDVSYLEAHGTATKVGDTEEVTAIDEVFGKQRQKPLRIGSVKCNIGHSEPASGLASLSKVIVALETGQIPPNINLKKVKDTLYPVIERRLKVVTEAEDLDNQEALVGINSFGFGGSNCHVMIRRFKKAKLNGGKPKDDVPRLVCVSGRTEEAVMTLINDLNRKPLDAEYVGLLHQVFKKDIKSHLHRGFTIISKNGPVKISQKFSYTRLPFYVCFGPLAENYKILGKYLLNFPVFRNTMLRINNDLFSKSVNIFDIILKKVTDIKRDTLGALAVQIGLVELLKSLDIYPDKAYGKSVGKLAVKYFNETITLGEALSEAYELPEERVNLAITRSSEFSEKVSGPKENFYSLNNYYSNEKGLNLQSDIGVGDISKSVILNISDQRFSTSNVFSIEQDVVRFLEFLGTLYEHGYNPQLYNLYPEVEFPVSRNTPSVSSSIRWNYGKSWHTYKFVSLNTLQSNAMQCSQMKFELGKLIDKTKYLSGHVVDGRNLVPATEYLRMAWETFAQSRRLNLNDIPVVFENCKFTRAVTLPSDGLINLFVVLHKSDGYFEVFDGESVVCNGRIFSPDDINSHKSNLRPWILEENEPSQVMQQDEIYRELYLRGYNYSGVFKRIIECNAEASVGMVQWENNWTAFMDKMLQIKILQLDTRKLYIPVSVDKLIIDPTEQLRCTREEDEIILPVHVYKDCDVVKSGGIEIHGLRAKSISKRKPFTEPVLEKHVFVPDEGHFDLATSVRINIQLVLENSLENEFKAVEISDVPAETETKFLLPLVLRALEDIPSVKPDLVISTKTMIEEIPGIKMENFTFSVSSNLSLIVGCRLLEAANLQSMLKALGSNGFILTREKLDCIPNNSDTIDIITHHVVDEERLILFRKAQEFQKTTCVEVVSNNFRWLPELQQALKSESNIIVYSHDPEFNGIMGFLNCIRREPGGSKVKCFFIMDDAKQFDPQHPFYRNQVKKNLAVNIYKGSKWGTYRHLLLEETEQVDRHHVRVNTISRGDLSSLKWIEGPLTLKSPLKEGQVLVFNYYSALNFKDIMLASGRLDLDSFSMKRLEQECWLGMEFCGKDISGNRVAGMINQSGLSTILVADKSQLWNVPECWTLEDAATVTVVYFTVIYALLKVTDVTAGPSILIHSATGGIGLAALNICLYYNCEVFVTVGTKEKRNYLKEHFPQISESHIGNSRDTTFEEMVKTGTKGRGVDIVLNSLTTEKLEASVRCLARGGTFLELGKYDLANNNALNLSLLEKELTYHGVTWSNNVHSKDLEHWIINTIVNGIKLGFVKPLPRTVFKQYELEKAFRYMTTGKHIGKVLVQVREEELQKRVKPSKTYIQGISRFNCDPGKCYVIVGGLGGVGLELTDWMVLRGAQNIVLVTSTSVKTGYQTRRISIWRSYGVSIHIAKVNIATQEGCLELLSKSNNIAPVDGIFNLAVTLEDALFEDQSEEKFQMSLTPKAYATTYLDKISRDLCPYLRYFVVFSSVSCGRGNAGQTNYGMANSIMERICERRKRDGLPALAIQWGAIGDVGLVAKMQKENKELVIGGTLQQKISSCLEVLDKLLKQDNPVVSSIVVAEKTSRNFGSGSPVDAVAVILGIKDMKTISQHATFAELGMDSMMGTEVVQILEKEFEIYVTAKDVRSLTFAKLTEMEVEKRSATNGKNTENAVEATNLLLQYLPENRTSDSNVVQLAGLLDTEAEGGTVFVFSGVEGVFKPLEQLTKKLRAHVFGVQYTYRSPEDSIEDSARAILPHVKKYISKDKCFHLVGYSYGVLVALEVANLLEEGGYIGGYIIAIDGSPAYSRAAVKQVFPEESEAEFQTSLMFRIMSMVLSTEILEQNKEKLLRCQNLEERIDLVLSLIPPNASKEELDRQGGITLYKRFKAILNYNFVHDKIRSNVHLVKAKHPMVVDIESDYKLSEICRHPVKVHVVEGDHATMLNQTHLVDIINQLLQK